MAILLRRGGAPAARSLLSLRAAAPSPSPFSSSSAAGGGGRVLASLASRGGFATGVELSRPELFLLASRRGFAKGRKARNEDDGGTVQAVPDIGPTVRSTATSQMDAAIVALSRELSKLRTGRASPGMLDHIMVETGDVKVALNHIAVVSVIDSHTLSVTPYDPDSLKSVERAIISSPLGINPALDGQRILAPIPPLTKENVQALCKIVTKSAEDVKQSIRRARQKALDTIKKSASSLPKDDVKRLEKEVEELTKKYIKTADDMCKVKEKEISGS